MKKEALTRVTARGGWRCGLKGTYLGLKLLVHKPNRNGRLANTTGTHHNEVVRAGGLRLLVLGTALRAEVVVLRVLVFALGALRHGGTKNSTERAVGTNKRTNENIRTMYTKQ